MVVVLLRCTGPVVRMDAREGVSAATGKPWRIPFMVVLVENQGVAEVNLSDRAEHRFTVGQYVDVLVEAETQGRYLSVRYVGDVAPAVASDQASA